MPFNQALRRLRKQDKLTQAELAEAIGVSKSTISMYECGNREPDFETLEALADYFNVDMNVLTGSSASPVSPSADTELNEYLELLKNRPECRMLFSLTKDATKEEVERAVAIIEALRKTEGK